MITTHFSPRLKSLFEHSVLTTDVARALRSAVAFAVAWIACLLTGHAAAAAFVATTAQNLSLVDVRGDYRSRLAILLTMTLVNAAAVFAGTLTGSNVFSATLMMGAIALLGGVWRHLSGDYGPNLAIISALLFLLALSQPGDWHTGLGLMGCVDLGGAGAIFIQLCGWFFRPQHPLRHAVAESWVAASDLISAMRTETNDGEPCAQEFTVKELAVRAAVDQTLAALKLAATKRDAKFLRHLDEATQIAARLATRVSAFNTAIETLRSQSDFKRISPTLDLLLRSLANTARSAALTIITHRSEQFIALEIRLKRCAHLVRILDERLALPGVGGTDALQARQMLSQIDELLSIIRAVIQDTVDHGSVHAGFALRLPELSEFSLRNLSSWLNPAVQVDSVLVRYTLRVTALTMIAVAVYQWFQIPRGYWIAFTALVVLQPDYGATRQKAAQRIAGTLAGSTLGSSLLWLKFPVATLVGLAAVMAFGFAYFLKRRYGLAVFFVTLMLVLITDAAVSVTMEFTVARFLSTLVGGALALLAALLFWPKWEQEQFPKIAAAAVRANRKYLETIAGRLARGEPFTGPAVLAKREVERANSLGAASVQRMLAEPNLEPARVQRAATLVAYSQRLTRAITVLAVHLNQREAMAAPEFLKTTGMLGAALETLAAELAAEKPAEAGLLSQVEKKFNGPEPESLLVYSQLAKIFTEIEALTLAARGSQPED